MQQLNERKQNDMKKNLYISLLSMVVLASCTKVDLEMPASIQPSNNSEVVAEKEISFQVAGYSLNTKAGSFEGSFKTFAYFTGETDWSSEETLSNAVTYINGAEIKNLGSSWKSEGKTYYWPKAGKMSFVSFAPSTAKLNVNDSKSELFSANSFEPSYDLMISDTATDKESSNNNVPVLFHHVLSQVRFTAQATEFESNGLHFEISINSISLENIAKKGDFSWNAMSNEASFGKQDSYYGSKQVSEGFSFSEDKQVMNLEAGLYIPQELSNVNMVINYTINTYVIENGSKVYVDKRENETKSFSMKGMTNGEWKSGYSYVYDITLSGLSNDNITVNPYIENDWKTIEHESNM